MRLRGGPGRRRQGPYAPVVEALQADYRVREAARVAYTFKLDPVTVLNGGRPRLREGWIGRLIRIAAHNIVQSDLKKSSARKGS